MKINLLQLLFLIIISFNSFAQMAIKESNSAPNPKAMLDVESNNKGILIPRMNTAARDGITSPPDGLMIYNNQTKKFNYFNNTIWQEAFFGDQWEKNGLNISFSGGFVGIGIPTPARDLVLNSAASPDILIQQNAFTGTTSTDGFLLGTNTNLDGEIWNFENAGIRFGTINIERMRILANGNVGINITDPSEKLEVAGSIQTTGNILLSATSEVNRTFASGSANLIPLAFGNISAAGAILGGTGNFTASKTATGTYEITVNGESITTVNNVFSAVPLSEIAQFATANSDSNKLIVKTFEISGLNQDGNFSFVVFKH